MFQNFVNGCFADRTLCEPKPAFQAAHNMATWYEYAVDIVVEANPAFVIGLLFFMRWLVIVLQVLNEALEVPARVVQ